MSSTKSGGGFALLAVATIFVLTIIIASMIFGPNSIVTYSIAGIVAVLAFPLICRVGGGNYILKGRGGYDFYAKEVSSPQSVYRAIDSSQVTRVILDDYSEEEYLVSGKTDESFGSACLRNWEFKSISKKGDWIIIDEKGNDITKTSLGSYQGIARIQSTRPMDRRTPRDMTVDTDDQADEYSDMESGVKFYD